MPLGGSLSSAQPADLGSGPAALVKGEVVGVFPEGTSHNHSKMMPIKDGVAWTALEYLSYLDEHHGGADVGGKGQGQKPAVVVPVGLTYSDKTKYRSRVAIECVSCHTGRSSQRRR